MGIFRLCIAIALLLPTYLSAEPISNGGFEQLDENGFPKAWAPVKGRLEGGTASIVVTDDAHSGKRAVRLELDAEKGMVGLNRRYKRGAGAGDMLTALKGGVEFWYKLVNHEGATVTFNIIPMKADGLEFGGNRTTFVIPPQTADGEWHRWRIKYDYTKMPEVKYIQIAPRIHHGKATVIFDDIKFMERIGGFLHIAERSLTEVAGREGKECRLSYKLENPGDAEVKNISCKLDLPEQLECIPAERVQTLKALPPDGKETIEWIIRGERSSGDIISLTVNPGGITDTLKLTTSVTLQLVKPSRFILFTGEEFEFSAVVRNSGTANAPKVRLSILPSEELVLLEGEKAEQEILVPAGSEVTAKWKMRAEREATDANILVRQNYEGEIQETSSVRHVVLPAGVEGDTPRLANDLMAIEFPPAPFGYGVGILKILDEGKWKTIGAFPRLARIIFLTRAGERVEHAVYAPSFKLGNFILPRAEETDQATPEGKGIPGSISFDEEYTDQDGRKWLTIVRFSIEAGSADIRVKATVSCSDDAKLLCFEAPMIYAGERADWDGEKTDALFAGLEWLVDGEVSSSTLDIAPPKHIRYAPHPNKVTIPLMSVRRDNLMLGIMWDAKHKWSEGNDRMSPVFASPNRFEGTSSHLMGLFVPRVDDWVDENTREARVPYNLKKDETLTLQFWLIANSAAKDALAGLDNYFKRFGVIDPMPIPRGNYEEEIKFSMQAYMKTLWIPEEKKWWSSISPNPLLAKPVWSPDYCLDLWIASQLVRDEKLAKAYRDRVAEVLPYLQGNYGIEFSFHMGNVERAFQHRAGAMAALISAQGADGEWRFDADRVGTGIFKGRDYHLLGPDEAVEAGTCAANAKALLEFALVTGDEDALEAGLKACKFMRRFDVPRAAQVWEVPVHCPDVLASALACHANIRAYELTRDENYLREAIRWAKTGLPFIYFWNDDRFPFMRYASIPVFGATWFKGSWFGRAVQWNGLAYSRALLDLARFVEDDALPWKKIAEGIIRSAMYQQATDEKDLALWPDSINCMDATKSKWIFAPKRIMDCLYALLGRRKDPLTIIFPMGKGKLHITSPAEVSKLAETGKGGISFQLEFPARDGFYTVIAPIEKPDSVLIDREPIKETKELEKSGESGWRYTPWMKMLVIKRHKGGICSVEISPARPSRVRFLPRKAENIQFDFDDGSPQGWRALHHVEDFEVADGMLQCRVTGIDPYIVRENLEVDASTIRAICVRMSVTGGGTAQLFWRTKDSPRWGEDKRINFSITPDGKMHDYRILIGEHQLWRGTITGIRLDPTSGSDGVGAAVKIDYLRGSK